MAHVVACKRHPVRNLKNLIPRHFFARNLEENQQLASCCRHPENHEVEAFYSSENWRDKLKKDGITPEPMGGVPDIYIFYCTCGRKHRRFMVGNGDVRPFWEVR